MANINYDPGPGNSPFGEPNANAQGTNFPGESAISPSDTLLLERVVKRIIFDAAPAQYKSLKVLFAKPFMDKDATEFTYLEKTFGRSTLVADAIAGAVPAVPNTTQVQVITMTAASIARLSLDYTIIYPNNDKATIVDITGNDVTVNSHTGQALPAVAVGDTFSIQSTITSDARDHINVYTRMETVERFNYIQQFIRARRWGRVELQVWKNTGKTDYLDKDKAETMEQIRVDMFNSFWNGLRGEVILEDGTSAKAMGGIYPTMQAAGSAEGLTSVAGFEDTFKTLAFSTNYKAEGATRFVYATDEMLHIFSQVFKLPFVEFSPNEEMANLNLEMMKLGTMRFVLVPCELWREESCFPADWARRIIVLDQETVNPCKLRGLPAFEMGTTLNFERGVLRDFEDFWTRSQLSIEFHNPLASFIINVQ